MKQMKYLLLLACLCFGASLLQAQTEETEEYPDVIYMENGSIFKGKIIEYEQGGTVRIVIRGGHELTLQENEIARIVQVDEWESAREKRNPVMENKPPRIKAIQYKTQGVFNHTHFGFNASTSDFGQLRMALQLDHTFGYQFNRLLGIGIGSGVNFFDQQETVIPLYAEFRSYPFKKNPGFFASVAGGYGFALRNTNNNISEAEGGWMSHPAIGYRIASSENLYLAFDLGVRFQQASFVANSFFGGGDTVRKDVLYQRTTLRVTLQAWGKKSKPQLK
jgi:hypothetical protein